MHALKYLFVGTFLAASAQHLAADEYSKSKVDARAVIERWQRVAVDVKSRQATTSDLAQRLVVAAQQDVASKAMAAALVGSPWAQLKDQEKADLSQLVGKLFARFIARALRGPMEPSGAISDTQLKHFLSKGVFTPVHAACVELFAINCWGFNAATLWKPSSGTSVAIDYLVLVSDNDDKWYIVDAKVNGIGFLEMYRFQFKQTFEGGGIANLLIELNRALARPLE